jgi:thiosulfate/3-mercaptopyruvate sulfurtransferase
MMTALPTLPTLPNLLSSEALQALQANQPNWSNTLVVVDASYYVPTEQKQADRLFEACHMPKAHFFDIDRICDHESDLPHMLPSVEQFEAALLAMGVTPESWIVVYDQKGVFSSTRFWWMCRIFGWQRVSVLDGGLPAWQRLGGATESGTVATAAAPQQASSQATSLGLSFNPALLATLQQILHATRSTQPTHSVPLILDARSEARFSGKQPEPRQGLASGHIPHSKNLPFSELLTNEGVFKAPEALKAIFAQVMGGGSDSTDPNDQQDRKSPQPAESIICTCGSGVTACIVAFALEQVGYRHVSVYDGSWAEYGQEALGLPISTNRV